jgi:ribosomal protein S18 acetylase RimI-like enzyme
MLSFKSDDCRWRKMEKCDVLQTEKLLRDMEENCVSACGRFLIRTPSNGNVWILHEDNGKISGIIISSRSTIIPVLCGKKEIPKPDFLKGLFRKKIIHSIQGLKKEVLILENEMNQIGTEVADIFDYDLMSLDNLPLGKNYSAGIKNLVLRVPQFTDLDEIAPLQAAYEKEEVLPKGSAFSAAASRINIANIIASGKILAAELDGRIVDKINVSAVSFSRYQVGGVYIHPDFRGMGIARCMATQFIASLINEGVGVTLFVKKNNTPAQRLYLGLGFTVKQDYRITYY